MNQEELNANMTTLTHQITLLAEAFDRRASEGVAEHKLKRISKLSKRSFREKLPSDDCSRAAVETRKKDKVLSVPNGRPKAKRETSIEGLLKQVTTLAVSISTDELNAKPNSERTLSNPTNKETLEMRAIGDDGSRRGSGISLPDGLGEGNKLKRTNLMRRRESQALLEGVRKLRGATGSHLDVLNQNS